MGAKVTHGGAYNESGVVEEVVAKVAAKILETMSVIDVEKKKNNLKNRKN